MGEADDDKNVGNVIQLQLAACTAFSRAKGKGTGKPKGKGKVIRSNLSIEQLRKRFADIKPKSKRFRNTGIGQATRPVNSRVPRDQILDPKATRRIRSRLLILSILNAASPKSPVANNDSCQVRRFFKTPLEVALCLLLKTKRSVLGEKKKTNHAKLLKHVILHKIVERAGCMLCPACLGEMPVKYSICLRGKGMMVSHRRCPFEFKEEDEDDEEAMEVHDDDEIRSSR